MQIKGMPLVFLTNNLRIPEKVFVFVLNTILKRQTKLTNYFAVY